MSSKILVYIPRKRAEDALKCLSQGLGFDACLIPGNYAFGQFMTISVDLSEYSISDLVADKRNMGKSEINQSYTCSVIPKKEPARSGLERNLRIDL